MSESETMANIVLLHFSDYRNLLIRKQTKSIYWIWSRQDKSTHLLLISYLNLKSRLD